MMDALRHWSEDEFRSMNAQIEMVLTEALRKAGRLKTECETTGKGKKGKENSPKSK
jgi:hypothetical protein